MLRPEAFGPSLQGLCKILTVVVHACNPSAAEAETGECSRPAGQMAQTDQQAPVQGRPCLSAPDEWHSCYLWPPHSRVHAHIQTCTNTNTQLYTLMHTHNKFYINSAGEGGSW